MGITLALLVSFTTNADQQPNKNPDIELSKSEQGDWAVTYTLEKPASKLVFLRNPDQSRVERWTPKDAGFALQADEQGEYIVRLDGEPFSRVSFSLTPTYRSLLKDYAPFSPFSDGGSLAYSGRFFTCVDSCEFAENQWRFTAAPPANEHVIVNGAIHTEAVSWNDQDSGRNLYIGQQHPIEGASFVALIDDKLPDILKSVLDAQLPQFMAYFSQKLGVVAGAKPMLFASYSNKPGSSSQGGTLPNQIFMHWDFDDLEDRIQSQQYVDQTLWFFAHEAAHFFQRTPSGESLFGESEQSWIHEGGADYLAMMAVRDMYPKMQSYIDTKVEQYQQHCASGLTETALIEAGSKGQFMLYYSCGFFVHKALDEEIRSQSQNQKSIVDLWHVFGQQVDAGNVSGADTFWQAASAFLPAESVAQKQAVLNDSTLDPERFWLMF
ncbi:hypothetical protein [Alteromonas facilis]|uniref:hypothetical protein n=1 Tax=Alteromonas facilis TaxID=2048004 RepID=UPI000F5CD7AD|nr:hypothetical protein [Alteromonas facilis]